MPKKPTLKQIERLKTAFENGAIITPQLITYFTNNKIPTKRQGAEVKETPKKRDNLPNFPLPPPLFDEENIFSKNEKIIIKPINGNLLI